MGRFSPTSVLPVPTFKRQMSCKCQNVMSCHVKRRRGDLLPPPPPPPHPLQHLLSVLCSLSAKSVQNNVHGSITNKSKRKYLLFTERIPAPTPSPTRSPSPADCTLHPCQNGGVGRAAGADCVCFCPWGWQGAYCHGKSTSTYIP